MPRPRVAPQDRQRAVRACIQCRASKKRCNGQQPCPNCIRKGITRSCVFTDPTADTSGSESIRPTSRTSMSSRDGAGGRREAHAALSSSLSGHTQENSSPEASYRTQPRLLNSLRGDKVFVGGSASLSFLQYVRDIVSQSLGNSKFSQHAEQDYMLESPQLDVRPIAELPLSVGKQSEFIDLAFTASVGLIEFWTKEWVLRTISQGSNTTDARSQLKLAIAHTVLAIGAQCVATDDDTSSIARSYFADAQEHVFAARLQISNLEIVQALLLMTFYLMGACQRNAAYTYLGIAVRIAFVLGLHCDHDASQSSIDALSHVRELTWKSLVTLDVMISSILGRPAAISTQSLGEDATFLGEEQRLSNIALHANFRLACLLDQKVQKLYLTEKVTAKSARACLDLLGRWSASIPEDLRRVPDATSDQDSLNKAISGLHVSCAYYFGVMLVSRPFLVLHLTNRLTLKLQEPQSLSGNALPHEDLAEIEEIATACINAATYLIQTCTEIRRRGILPANMRIVKAWVFAAGLVLGFDMFTMPQSEPEVEEAFRNCCDILRMLSNKSIQAGHYCDILTSLFDAITARRQQMSTKNKRSIRPIVEKIMAFDNQQSDQENRPSTTTGVDPSPVASNNTEGFYNQDWPQDFVVDLDFQTMMNEPFLNWGSTDFITWA